MNGGLTSASAWRRRMSCFGSNRLEAGEPDGRADELQSCFAKLPTKLFASAVNWSDSFRMAKLPPEIPTTREVHALLRVAGRGRTAHRNRAIIVTMWRGGLRCAETLSLAPRDVQLDRGIIRIRQGKGRKARTVVLDPEACAVVQRWLAVRGDQPLKSPLYCTLRGDPVDPSYLRHLLPRLAKRAGIEKRIHSHGLRHTYAVELSREGVPIPLIRAGLGHANIATTHTYLTRLENQELVKAIRTRPEWGLEFGREPMSLHHHRDGVPSSRMTLHQKQLCALPKNEWPPDDAGAP